MEKIYVKLLNEGSLVYRPVNAQHISKGIYLIDETNDYNSDDEIWEFAPGMTVNVELRQLDDHKVIAAISRIN